MRSIPALLVSSSLCALSFVAAGACGGTVVAVDGSVVSDSAALPDVSTDAPQDTTAPIDAAMWDAAISIPDSGNPLSPKCAASGGLLCSNARWTLCPIGFQPIASGDGHADCDRGGWCCVQAPPSSCSSTDGANCVPGLCTGCLMNAAPAISCNEVGRSCCVYVCN